MKRRSASGQVLHSGWIGGILIVLLLAYYVASLVSYYQAPPSALMNRGVAVARLAPLDLRTNPRPLFALSIPGRDESVFVGVDGESTRMMRLDPMGRVILDRSLELDLSGARGLSTWMIDGDTVALISREKGVLSLHEVDIETGFMTTRDIADNALSFINRRDYLMYSDSDQVYGIVLGGSAGPVSLDAGKAERFAMDVDDTGFFSLVIHDEGGRRFRGEFVAGNVNLGELQRFPLDVGPTEEAYRGIRDLRIHGNVVDLLFVFRDNKFGANQVTVLRVDRHSGRSMAEYRATFPLIHSDFRLISGARDSVSFMMGYPTDFGPNLVVSTLSEGERPHIDAVTKTRGWSLPVGRLSYNDSEALVFADLNHEGTVVYFASNHPDFAGYALRPTSDDIKDVLGAMLSNLVLAVFVGLIYLLTSLALPAVVIALLNWSPSLRRRLNLSVMVGIGVVVALPIKLLFTRIVMTQTPHYRYPAPLFGTTPTIYIVLVLASLVSFALVLPTIRSEDRNYASPLGLFTRCHIWDTSFFVMLFIVYGVTGMMIGKI